MRISSSGARLLPVLVLACALSACGGGSDGNGGFFGGTPAAPTTPTAPTTPPVADTGTAPVKSCAP